MPNDVLYAPARGPNKNRRTTVKEFQDDLTIGRVDATIDVHIHATKGRPLRPKSAIDAVMKSAEHREMHVPRVRRPHLAQEFKDRQQHEHAEGITFALTPHARLCAKGETRAPRA